MLIVHKRERVREREDGPTIAISFSMQKLIKNFVRAVKILLKCRFFNEKNETEYGKNSERFLEGNLKNLNVLTKPRKQV